MKRLPGTVLFFFLPLLFVLIINGCNLRKTPAVALDVAASPLQKLSEYNFFAGVLNTLTPNERVVPYDLVTPLFTDYAFKARFVYVPEGKNADYDTSQVLQFPVGSCLIKNFYYPDDFRKPEGKRRILETRLLVHRQDGWEAIDYVWNDNQTEAVLDNAGDIKEISWVHYDGTKKQADYLIPNKNQCKGCHWNNGVAIVPIGPKIRNLNRDFDYADGTENQLTRWVKLGILKEAPTPDAAPRIADWMDSTHYSVDQRARAYLEMNCGHCHNPEGPAYTSGLYLDINNRNPENLGVCKAPVAAGKATGNHLFDIVPGHPDESIFMYRMISDDPGIRMPEVGRSLMHVEGVALISQWIAEMKGPTCDVD